jgi:hypothetical protein
MRSYWLVSPNVKNHNPTVSDWKRASVRGRAAFMGYGPGDNQIGRRFVHEIKPGDIILIARRHKWAPEIVGFGIVKGGAKQTTKVVKTPEHFGAMRRLSPFVATSKAPSQTHIIDILHHTASLTKLRPATNKAHALVCKWMARLLPRNRKSNSAKTLPAKAEEYSLGDTQLVDSPRHHQLDYLVRSKKRVTNAKKNEARLLIAYQRWLNRQGRKMAATKHGKLQCDGFEKERRNLIEAKSSISREHIRMAVGQLLDYAFQIEKKFGKLNLAILLPRTPDPKSVNWLPQRNISLIWREKTAFRDNANSQFI